MTRRCTWAAGLLLGALLLAACNVAGEPPEASTTTVGSLADDQTARSDSYVTCLRQNGIHAELMPDGAVFWIAPENQLEAYDAIDARCLAEAEERFPLAPAPTTSEEIAAFYEQLLETAQCLIREGYEPPPAPSLQTFVETFHEAEGPWHPYQSIRSLNAEEWHRINEACPQP